MSLPWKSAIFGQLTWVIRLKTGCLNEGREGLADVLGLHDGGLDVDHPVGLRELLGFGLAHLPSFLQVGLVPWEKIYKTLHL